MYLDKILGSTTKVNVLSTLLANPQRSFVEKELAKESGCSPSEINRQMSDLVSSNVVLFQKIANVKTYKINEEHFLFKPLSALFKDLNLTYREIAKNLVKFSTKMSNIACVILLGSLSKGAVKEDTVTSPSDIDIIFIAEKETDVKKIKEMLIEHINSEISKRYGLTIYPIVMSKEDYKKGLINNNFILTAQAKGEILYGSKPRRIG